jgi:hypothetical protein
MRFMGTTGPDWHLISYEHDIETLEANEMGDLDTEYPGHGGLCAERDYEGDPLSHGS